MNSDETRLKLGMVGLGRMGSNMTHRLVGAGHEVVVYDVDRAAVQRLVAKGASGVGDLDVAQVAELWKHGSVVRSWLLDLAASALRKDPRLEKLSGWVEDSGEGRWTLDEAIARAVPMPALAAALFARFASRREDAYANRLLAALRQEFGGHTVRVPDGGTA
jgi:6-phosphogluconate dehydrogenase